MLSRFRELLLIALILLVGLAVQAGGSDASAVLWRDPGAIEQRDLKWGAGSAARAPRPPFVFVEEDLSGSKPKIHVTDHAGVKWTVKLAPADPAMNEVHAEIAAGRIVWALGYWADENYFMPDGRIDGVQGLKRAAGLVGPDGSFRIARFERMADGGQKFAEWNIDNNRFKGTRELSGLQMLMIVLGSWDFRDDNTWIYRVKLAESVEDRYVVTDLGSTFGRAFGGAGAKPTRWNLTDYRDARIVSGLSGGYLVFRYPLTGNTPLRIPVAHARWFTGMASRLSAAQLRDAFTVAGASAQDIENFASEFSKRIDALVTALR